MSSEVLVFFTALIGAIIGGLTSILTTYFNNKKDSKIQLASDDLKRQGLLRDFQRKNLIELQNSLQELMRLFGRLYMEDLKNYQINNNWGKSEISAELDLSLSNRFGQINTLIERIQDNDLRVNIKKFINDTGEFLVSKSEEVSKKRLFELSTKSNELNEQIGVVLRSNY